MITQNTIHRTATEKEERKKKNTFVSTKTTLQTTLLLLHLNHTQKKEKKTLVWNLDHTFLLQIPDSPQTPKRVSISPLSEPIRTKKARFWWCFSTFATLTSGFLWVEGKMMGEEGKSKVIRTPEVPDLLLQWGNRKRLRCVKVKENGASRVHRRVVKVENESSPLIPLRREWESWGKSSQLTSPEKEENRFYSTRGSTPMVEENFGSSGGDEKGRMFPPRFFISLSNKEKEEDFMAMKGCKLPQRPKKRAKLIQKTILLVSPGAWLSDLSQERYEVREKKSSRKRRRGLKAMSMESESE